jgi:uncharacterized repeat protein (TIGR03803 family)
MFRTVAMVVGLVAAGVVPMTAAAASATTTTLHSFSDGADGGAPGFAPIDGGDGLLYGVTQTGGVQVNGAYGFGTIYRTTAGGSVETLATFDKVTGQHPQGLTRAPDGSFYGLASHGGHTDPNAFTTGSGSLFRFDPVTGSATKLWEIRPIHGAWPSAAPTIGPDGALYGTGRYGGAFQYYGTVWRWTPQTGLRVIHDFNLGDGKAPLGPLTVGRDGWLYGTTDQGAGGCGSVYKISPTGAFHSFGLGVGCNPKGGVIQASDGNFYGTTYGTGAGTVFRMTPAGEFSLVHRFDYQYAATGGKPVGPLMQATDGLIYGTTDQGGATGQGVVFRFDPATNNFQVVHEFRGDDGQGPTAGVTQWSDGRFYGVTGVGGAFGRGVLYSFSAAGLPAPQPPVTKATLSALLLEPSTVVGGATATGTVTLTAAAPPGGARVALTSSSRSVSVPAAVTIPEGTNQLRFAISSRRVKGTTPVTVTASYDGATKHAVLTLTR